jgi:hypothetical protein
MRILTFGRSGARDPWGSIGIFARKAIRRRGKSGFLVGMIRRLRLLILSFTAAGGALRRQMLPLNRVARLIIRWQGQLLPDVSAFDLLKALLLKE